MNNYKALKQLIIQQLLSVIQDKIDLATTAIESATDSRNCDTKSSAGDKYETAREMIQIEIEKHKIQLANAQKLKGDLLRIDETISPIRALLGSLIITETELYFLSIGIGKIIVNNQNVFAIRSE